MNGSFRRAAGGVGVLALAVVAAGTASASSLQSGVQQQIEARRKIEARCSRFRPRSTSA